MKILQTVDRVLLRIEYVLLVIFLGVMIVLSFAQVILRNFFDTGFLWADPLIRHLVIWVGFVGAGIAASEERHIGIDALTKFMSPRWISIARIFTSLFVVIVCFYLTDASWTFLMDEKGAGGDVVLSIPVWIAILIIPVGYILMGIHFGVKGVEYFVKAIGKSGEKI